MFSGMGALLQRDGHSRDREAAKHKVWVSGGQSYCKGRGRSQYGKKQHLFMEVEGKGENKLIIWPTYKPRLCLQPAGWFCWTASLQVIG